jgi:phospholipase/carboxylesterase
VFGKNCPSIIPAQPVQKLVVFLHGYGSNGDDLIDIGNIWQPHLKNTAFYSPNALEISEVNPFGGYQWFGLKDLEPFNVRPGLDKHQKQIADNLNKLLDQHKLLPSDLILVGFSQGTMVALDVMFSINNLAGIIGYCGAFYKPSNAVVKLAPPVLLAHGTADMVVPYAMLEHSRQELTKLGVNVVTHTVKNLGHGLDESSINAGLEFIKYQQQNQPIAL